MADDVARTVRAHIERAEEEAEQIDKMLGTSETLGILHALIAVAMLMYRQRQHVADGFSDNWPRIGHGDGT